MNYNKALSQYNTTLKYFASNRTFDTSLLALYDDMVEEDCDIEHRKLYGRTSTGHSALL